LAVHQLYGATMSVSAIENHQSEITNRLTLSAKGERGQSQGFNPNPELNKETLSTVLLPLGEKVAGGRMRGQDAAENKIANQKSQTPSP
jgi:hypothetical protein